MDACHNKQGKNDKRQTKHDDKPMHNLRNCSPCGTLGTLCFPTQRTPLQRTLHIYRKRILYIYIYIYHLHSTHIAKSRPHERLPYVPPPTRKKVLLDTTYKHALSLSLFLLHSRYVYVERLFVFTCSDLIGASRFLHSHSKSHTGSLSINFVVTKSKTTSTIIVAEQRQKLPQFSYDI